MEVNLPLRSPGFPSLPHPRGRGVRESMAAGSASPTGGCPWGALHNRTAARERAGANVRWRFRWRLLVLRTLFHSRISPSIISIK